MNRITIPEIVASLRAYKDQFNYLQKKGSSRCWEIPKKAMAVAWRINEITGAQDERSGKLARYLFDRYFMFAHIGVEEFREYRKMFYKNLNERTPGWLKINQE